MDESTERAQTVANRSATGSERSRLPIAAAAERLGLSTDAVRGRIHRGTLHGVKIDGIWHVEMPEPVATAKPFANGDRTVSDRSATAATVDPTVDPTGHVGALLEAKDQEIAYLRAALDAALAAERDERRRADTIILELSRRPVALPADADAPVAAQEPAHATKSAAMAAAPPTSSLWERLRHWIAGA